MINLGNAKILLIVIAGFGLLFTAYTGSIIPLIGIIAIIVAIVVGRGLASGLRDDQRKIVGGVAPLVGIVLAIYGISSVNSLPVLK